MVVKIKCKDIVKYIAKDKEQLKILKLLAEKRKLKLKDIVKRGIFAVPDQDELDYLLEQWGYSFEDVFGKETTDVNLVTNGFMIPVLDSSNRILFYINYNWERVKSRHYLNVFPDELYNLSGNIKMYGGHNLAKGIKEGWVVVVEGLFDGVRLETEGVPVVALLGSKLLDFHKVFLSRFDQVIYIPDNDAAGEKGWRSVKYGLDNAFKYKVEGLYKDVDEFAREGGMDYELWLKRLKMYRRNKV